MTYFWGVNRVIWRCNRELPAKQGQLGAQVMWAVALGSSSLPRAQQNGHVFIACSASASAWGNQVCCRCQGRDQGECVQAGASCFQWSLLLPGELPSDSRSCLSSAVWDQGLRACFSLVNIHRLWWLLQILQDLYPVWAWVESLLCPCYQSLVQPGPLSFSVLSAGFWLGAWCSHDGRWWWSLELWQLCSEHRVVIFSRRGCCLNIF